MPAAGELQTVTGVQLVRSHHAAREEQYRLAVGLHGAEAMLRLFTEQEANATCVSGADALSRPARRPRAACRAPGARSARAFVPAQAALAVRLPAASHELRGLRHGGGAARRLLGESGRRGLPGLQRRWPLSLSPAGIAGIEALLARPLAEARDAGLAERSTRDALAVITSAYEYFGNFRLRTLRSA